jgi:acylpyruvate hydrolase
VDKIICVGKNYAEHAAELGDAVPEKPVIFLKPPSVLRQAQSWGVTLESDLPPGESMVHHECEIVLRLDKGGYRLSLAEAQQCIGAVTLGLDMTLRDRQTLLKKNGHPWTISKVFPDSAFVGPWIPLKEFSDYLEVPFHFEVGTEIRQVGKGKEMIFGPAQCVALASEFFPVCPGDCLFTGTPKGVNRIVANQTGRLVWKHFHYSVHWK